MLKDGRTPHHYYRPIGDVFDYEDKDGNKVTLEVVKCRLCEGCYFDHRETECGNSEEVTGSCVTDARWDETSVIFKEVKNEKRKRKWGKEPAERGCLDGEENTNYMNS